MTRAEKLRKLALYIPDPGPILEIAEEVEAVEKRLVDLESNISFLMGAVTALRMHNKEPSEAKILETKCIAKAEAAIRAGVRPSEAYMAAAHEIKAGAT